MPFSSLKNIQKSNQRIHKERAQPEKRSHFGLLPKKKDFKVRAKDFEKKQKILTGLKRKALDRNEDEFYFGMVNSKVEDGVHKLIPKVKSYSKDELSAIMQQDCSYVSSKLVSEKNKCEKLRASLHLIGLNEEKPVHSHTFFVNSNVEARSFDPVKRFDTHPSLLTRSYNRLRLSQLSDMNLSITKNGATVEDVAHTVHRQSKKAYQELAERERRIEQLTLALIKMEAKQTVINNNKTVKMKTVREESNNAAPVYKFPYKRKR